MESATAISRGGRRKETPEAPQVDAARFIGRVAKAFHTAQERGGTLQLRLSPPELGALKLQLTVKDGVLSATLETERPDTRQLLLEHLPALRDRLAEQNIRVERFDVDVGQDQHRGQADPRNDNPHSEQGRTERAVKQRAATGNGRKDSAPAREQTAPAPRIGNTNINLVI
jgi:flagellar hook-length control protein FliK